MPSQILLDDLIILGRACPEPLKDGRITVCLAGWSEKNGFIRIYPTRFDMKWRRWDVVKVEVQRNDRDTRDESWKIEGSKPQWDQLASKIEVTGRVESRDQRRNIIGNLADDCVSVINEQRRSLGIIKPDVHKTYFKSNPKYGEIWQQGLPGLTDLGSTMVKREFQDEPRVIYRCGEHCQTKNPHDQQILEWGFYEWLRKEPERKEQVWDNAGFHSENTDIYFLVGNQAAHRTSFMVISVLRVPSGEINAPLFPLRKTRDR